MPTLGLKNRIRFACSPVCRQLNSNPAIRTGVNSTVVAVSCPEEEEEPETTPEPTPTTQFAPPANASLGVATVPQRESLPPHRLISPTPAVETAAVAEANPAMATDAVLAESTWSNSDYTAVAKDLVAASAKRSTITKDEPFALEIIPYDELD